MYHSFLIHLSANGHPGCFHVLAVVNSASVNIGVHVSLSVLVSSRCLPSSGIVGSYGSSIPSFLRNLYTVLHSGCTSLFSHQKRKKLPFSPHLLHIKFRKTVLMILHAGQKMRHRHKEQISGLNGRIREWEDLKHVHYM